MDMDPSATSDRYLTDGSKGPINLYNEPGRTDSSTGTPNNESAVTHFSGQRDYQDLRRPLPKSYSDLNVSIGSSLAARRAGTIAARIVTSKSVAATATSVTGS